MDFVFEAAKATIIQGQINPKKGANRTLFIGGGDHRTGAITTGQAQQNLPEASNTQRTRRKGMLSVSDIYPFISCGFPEAED